MHRRQEHQRSAGVRAPAIDTWLVGTALLLLVLGVLMVFSASISIADRQMGQPTYYLLRQSTYVLLGLLLAGITALLPLRLWQKAAAMLLMCGFCLLVLVLIPGIGRAVNGSYRWIMLGVVNLQVSELVKLFVVIYLADYLVRRGDEVRSSARGFFKPMLLLSLLGVLLMLEPDFGATVVMVATALGMMFLGGARLWQFLALIMLVLASLAALAVFSPYRLQRLTGFLDPWADPFNSGFQLTQALIAFGRGEWFGVGLGGSIQKLFYLPEAHTDFVFAVLAEELGLVGAVSVIALFTVMIWRAFAIGRLAERAGQAFAAYLAYGLGLWIGLQAYINIGVNMGVLPTKGLTLPLMSYGGSSIVVMCIAVALLQRVYHEAKEHASSARSQGRGS
ncbi:MAG: cell division protein FtsW [Gammaproteobacteria bacterium RBG_16_57_12]|nr:MAG: cell division protein FtsW [Gammaproteobacteria bacterium RBG_16_57_12]